MAELSKESLEKIANFLAASNEFEGFPIGGKVMSRGYKVSLYKDDETLRAESKPIRSETFNKGEMDFLALKGAIVFDYRGKPIVFCSSAGLESVRNAIEEYSNSHLEPGM